MSGALGPLIDAPVLRWLGVIAVLMLIVFTLGRSGRLKLAPVGLRLLAVTGLILPAVTIIGWYEQLSRAREWAQSTPVEVEPVAEQFLVNTGVLLAIGFFVLIGGIYLARQLQSPPAE